MATNEIFKHSDWIPLPIPEAAEDSVPGDPILVGGLVGVIQVVGGQILGFTTDSAPTLTKRGGVTVNYMESSTSLEEGWASVALTGAWAFEIEGANNANIGDPVFITQGTGGDAATLSFTSGGADMRFGYLINMTTDGRAIVRIEGGDV